ncbi:hypothetical protein SALBM311S_02260 [Streptomyces alboniger]
MSAFALMAARVLLLSAAVRPVRTRNPVRPLHAVRATGDIRSTPEFTVLRSELWDLLRKESVPA